jgi:hypothetical protein
MHGSQEIFCGIPGASECPYGQRSGLRVNNGAGIRRSCPELWVSVNGKQQLSLAGRAGWLPAVIASAVDAEASGCHALVSSLPSDQVILINVSRDRETVSLHTVSTPSPHGPQMYYIGGSLVEADFARAILGRHIEVFSATFS